MAGKTRVHQLAKELGVTSAALLARLAAQGVVVKSASSTVEAPVARRLRESYRLGVDAKSPSFLVGHEPPHVYIGDRSSPITHHRDYLADRGDAALCGHRYIDPVTHQGTTRPSAVCEACEARLPEYHLRWWRDQYHAANGELEQLRTEYRKLKERSDHMRRKLSDLQQSAHGAKHKRQNVSAQNPRRQKQKLGRTKIAKVQRKPVASRFASQLGIPVVSKQQVAHQKRSRTVGPAKVRKTIKTLPSRDRKGPKTEAEKVSDELARESMRSYKPSSWRLGRSPGSYG